MPFLIAQIQPPQEAPNARRLSSPAGAANSSTAVPLGTQQILPPSAVRPPSTQDPFSSERDQVESPEQRRNRLLEAGVIDPVAKGNPIKSELEILGEKYLPDVVKQGLLFAQPENIFELTFGSWKALRSPKGTSLEEDFSAGAGFLFYLPSKSQPEKWSLFLGPAVLFLNGTVYTTARGPFGTSDPFSADWNSTEVGAQAMVKFGDSRGKWFSQGWELSATYMPLRLLKTTYEARAFPLRKSEASSHTSLSYFGLGAQASYRFELARTVGVGPLLGISMASPFQVRARLGLTLSLASFEQNVKGDMKKEKSDIKKENSEKGEVKSER